MKKITKHDVKVFILGMFTFFILESLYNWEETSTAFIQGYNQTRFHSNSK
jgi:hypothetical protein